MNPRIIKEARALFWPWCVAMLAGVFAAARPLMTRADWPVAIGAIGFFAGGALLAALSFGAEFQQRTLQLLVCQPVERSRIWREKLGVLIAAVLLLTVVHGIGQRIGDKASWGDLIPAGFFMLVLVCSAGFWTLVARSTIGGMTFSATVLFLLMLGLQLAVEKIYGSESEVGERAFWTAAGVAGLVYAGGFLWLGWRQFARIEMRETIPWEGRLLPESLANRTWLSALIRCQPNGRLRNLVRKELRLLKPVFLVAAVFTLCWFATWTGLQFQPARINFYHGLFALLIGVCAPLTVLLAGCISLGEERNLGLNAWHLTLPVSAFTQWFVKLSVAAGTAFGLGVLLPSLLALLTIPDARPGFGDRMSQPESVLPFVIFPAGVFILSFWSATLVGTTVRAVLTTVVVAPALGFCAMIGGWCAEQLGGLQTGLLTSLVVHFQLPPEQLSNWLWHELEFQLLPGVGVQLGEIVILIILGSLATIALSQSLFQFRRGQLRSATLFKCAIPMLVIIFASTFWWMDLTQSINRERLWEWKVVEEIENTIRLLPRDDAGPASDHTRVFTPRELERTGKLSEAARSWLRNASITCPPELLRQPDRRRNHWYQEIIIRFPNGRSFQTEIEVPEPGGQ